MPFLTINDISLHYRHVLPEAEAKKTPILLLAGMASDSASWQPVIGSLSKNHELVIPDNRCSGRTTPALVSTNREIMVSDTLSLLNSLNIEKFSILGHSMGGMLGWEIAARVPGRVEHLIAAAALPSAIQARVSLFESLSALRLEHSEAEWFKLLYQFLFHPKFFDNTAGVNDAVAASMQYPYKQGAEAFAEQVKGLMSFLAMPDITAITCDITMITGSHDILTTPSMMNQYAADIPKTTTHVIEDAAHALHWEQTEKFVECVLSALER